MGDSKTHPPYPSFPLLNIFCNEGVRGGKRVFFEIVAGEGFPLLGNKKSHFSRKIR